MWGDMNIRKILIIIYIFLILAVNVYAWWSFPYIVSTHYKLTNDAINLINSDSCQYVTQFNNDIKKWSSGYENDKNAHNGDIKRNFGDPDVFWEDAKTAFDAGNIAGGKSSAFYYISLIIHLIEDMAVPAHVYNIQHSPSFSSLFDNMEYLVYFNYVPDITGVIDASGPTSNYDDRKNYTRNATSSDFWHNFWIPQDNPDDENSYGRRIQVISAPLDVFQKTS